MAIKTFTDAVALPASDINTYLTNSGLVYIASTTFAGATPGVEMSNCFSSTYDNYEVHLTYYGSAANNTNFQLMTGTNTKDGSATYNRYGYYWLAGINALDASSDVQFFVANHGTTAGSYSNAQSTFFRPNVAGVKTEVRHRAYSGDSNLTVYLDQTTTATTAYTGLYLYPGSGNITGTITIYGYRKP
jgi:hypothetical protein